MAAELLVLVDSVRDGFYSVSPDKARSLAIVRRPSCSSTRGDDRLQAREDSGPKVALGQIVQFLGILKDPRLHFDLREMICGLVYEKNGFIPSVMVARSKEDLFGEMRDQWLHGERGEKESCTARIRTWGRRVRGLSYSEFEKTSLVTPMTFGVVKFAIAAVLSTLLVMIVVALALKVCGAVGCTLLYE